MPQTPPFSPFVPTGGISENLIPNPPAEIPEAPEAGNAMAAMADTPEAQKVNDIIAGLTLRRELPLYIPEREKHMDKSYHVINDNPQEMAEAMRIHWQPCTDPRMIELFGGKVSGVDKTGKIMRPVLMERDARITAAYDKLTRQQLRDMYQAMDPRNRPFNSKYAETDAVINAGITKGQFSGQGWRIKV